MTRIRLLLIPLIFQAWPLCAFAAPNHHRLVSNGSPESTIVLGDMATPAAELAAWELRHAVEQMTGVTLPIWRGTALPEGNHILIGDNFATRQLGLKPDSFSYVEYRVSVSPERVLLFGRDALTSKGRTINIAESYLQLQGNSQLDELTALL
ncbi:MAG: hypothetical protein ACI8W8_003393 [Rhodothermales bacterium]|jgi:hypothetical protein